ncbi:hypothetical protein [Allofournierella sp.]|uniref:hypothetical protein n=1 Tax=Allofournierella sp. TaxID=1940256 RepID=UPI003AB70CB3
MEYTDPLGLSQTNEPSAPSPSCRVSEKGGFWIALLRVVAWVMFFAIILLGLVLGGMLSSQEGSIMPFFLFGLVVFPLTALFSVSVSMILLDAAKNLMRLTSNSTRILIELQKK